MIRVIVADDHLVVREGLVAIMSTAANIAVVAEASTGVEAVAAVHEHSPDVLLLDLQMPELDGVGTIRALREAGSTTRILVFTAYDDDDVIVDAVRAGVDGYLLKGTGRDELLAAIASFPKGGDVVWVQEEPTNMGAWPYLKLNFGDEISPHYQLRRVSRVESASPSTGSMAAHKLEQEDLLGEAFEGL